MKQFFIILISIFSLNANAQISQVTIQASGLTCSMCSNAINKSLKKLSYVDQVKSNIKNSTFEITFSKPALVNFDQLKKKVEDAGFFVARFDVTMDFNKAEVKNDTHLNIGGVFYHFLNTKELLLNGTKKIQLLDKGYVTNKEFKKNAIYTKMNCYHTGVMGSCCSKNGSHTGTRIYHVTI